MAHFILYFANRRQKGDLRHRMPRKHDAATILCPSAPLDGSAYHRAHCGKKVGTRNALPTKMSGCALLRSSGYAGLFASAALVGSPSLRRRTENRHFQAPTEN